MFVNNIRALNVNGVGVGGLSALNVEGAYGAAPTSAPDGAVGEDVERMELGGTFDLTCSDLAKANAILDAAVSTIIYSGKIAGGSNWQHGVLTGPVIGGMNLNLPKGADGTLNLSGAIRFADDAASMNEAHTFTEDATPPEPTYPERLWRPNGASFDPGTPIAPKNLVSIGLSMRAELEQEGGDQAVGMTAVERGQWSPLDVTMVFKDKTLAAGLDICYRLLHADRGVLTAGLRGRAGGANRTLTVNNVLWLSVKKQKTSKFWQFTLSGKAGWRYGATVYTLNGAGDKLFQIA